MAAMMVAEDLTKADFEERLTPTEQDIVDYLARTGADTEGLALAFDVTYNTMRTHLNNIHRALGTHTREAIVSAAWMSGYVRR